MATSVTLRRRGIYLGPSVVGSTRAVQNSGETAPSEKSRHKVSRFWNGKKKWGSTARQKLWIVNVRSVEANSGKCNWLMSSMTSSPSDMSPSFKEIVRSLKSGATSIKKIWRRAPGGTRRSDKEPSRVKDGSKNNFCETRSWPERWQIADVKASQNRTITDDTRAGSDVVIIKSLVHRCEEFGDDSQQRWDANCHHIPFSTNDKAFDQGLTRKPSPDVCKKLGGKPREWRVIQRIDAPWIKRKVLLIADRLAQKQYQIRIDAA
ncbi:hypothetical protein B0H10DRAFT_1957582 [Mycena sp. CBHHK59/15]|nr:hypothetical protein B0H10DRAFT_1957582 [Mycena sp. CBHHK59/15]